MVAVSAAGSLGRLPSWLAALLTAGPLVVAGLRGGAGVLLALPLAVAAAYGARLVRLGLERA